MSRWLFKKEEHLCASMRMRERTNKGPRMQKRMSLLLQRKSMEWWTVISNQWCKKKRITVYRESGGWWRERLRCMSLHFEVKSAALLLTETLYLLNSSSSLSPLLPHYSLLLGVWLIQRPFVSGIMQHLFSCDWFISFRIRSPRLFHVGAWDGISFFL